MPRNDLNVALKGLDDLFSSEETRQEEQREQVQQIPVDELFPFKNHPFKVLDDDAMTRTVESISQFGVLAPLIARPRPEGGYEIISGHRRKHAAELAHLDTVPVIVRNMEDDAATILMVDSNLQREHILPSERAFAYKMKLDAMRRTSGRPSKENPRQVVGNFETAEIIGKESGESGRQVQRFIRLTNLVPELLDMVDEKKISFNPAVELSYLDALRVLAEAWEGDIDSLRDEVLQGVTQFVALYDHEYDPIRLIRQLQRTSPVAIYRSGQAMTGPNYQKYMLQILKAYNGSSRTKSLPIKQ